MSHDDIGPSCLNCNTRLHGKFCHSCGQKATSANVKLHDFVHEATHEFLHLDGKILKTLKLLVATPGQLTVEFLEGRRSRYISPLRVYLTFSLIFTSSRCGACTAARAGLRSRRDSRRAFSTG